MSPRCQLEMARHRPKTLIRPNVAFGSEMAQHEPVARIEASTELNGAALASTATCIKKLSILNIIWVVSEKNFGNFLDRFEWFGSYPMLHTHRS